MRYTAAGWIRDYPDERDHAPRYKSPPPAADLPPEVDLEPLAPASYIVDQGPTNSCVGAASASLGRFMRNLRGLEDRPLSRLFNYWLARHVPRMGWEKVDDGAMPRDAVLSMIANGVVPEVDWPFDIAKVNVRPPQVLLAKAKAHRVPHGKATRMLANDDFYHLKYSLAQKLPFLIGIDVFESFYDVGPDGIVPYPNFDREEFQGGHLMHCIGYRLINGNLYFKTPNSWNVTWADRGYCYLPAPYVGNRRIAGDFWRLEDIS